MEEKKDEVAKEFIMTYLHLFWCKYEDVHHKKKLHAKISSAYLIYNIEFILLILYSYLFIYYFII